LHKIRRGGPVNTREVGALRGRGKGLTFKTSFIILNYDKGKKNLSIWKPARKG